jgi:hypothetical protein
MRRTLALMLTSVMVAITGGTALAGLSSDPDTLRPREGADEELHPYREGGARMRPSSEVFHAGLALHPSSLLHGRACGRTRR